MRYLKYFFLVLLIGFFCCAIPDFLYENEGKSKAIGSVRNGSLENAYLMPYSGENFSYFSPFSYYVLNNAYAHSTLYKTILDAYKSCEISCPNTDFKLMECANYDGGKMFIHRTHQNGLSADFMSPLKRKDSQGSWTDYIGIFHYALDFSDEGELNFDRSTQVDFEVMARHILALDEAARQNGLEIHKIILKIELKDDFYATPSGRKVKERGIYIVQGLSHIVNILHDDHYHIDFREL